MEIIQKSMQEIIQDAAFEVWSRDPSASMTEIAKASGVGRATLYRYYPSREDLLNALTISALREVNSASIGVENEAETTTHIFYLIIKRLLPLYDRFKFLSLDISIERQTEIRALLTQQYDEMRKLIQAAKMEEIIQAKLPDQWVIDVFDNLIYTGWLGVYNDILTEEAAVSLVFNTFFGGVGVNSEVHTNE